MGYANQNNQVNNINSKYITGQRTTITFVSSERKNGGVDRSTSAYRPCFYPRPNAELGAPIDSAWRTTYRPAFLRGCFLRYIRVRMCASNLICGKWCPGSRRVRLDVLAFHAARSFGVDPRNSCIPVPIITTRTALSREHTIPPPCWPYQSSLNVMASLTLPGEKELKVGEVRERRRDNEHVHSRRREKVKGDGAENVAHSKQPKRKRKWDTRSSSTSSSSSSSSHQRKHAHKKKKKDRKLKKKKKKDDEKEKKRRKKKEKRKMMKNVEKTTLIKGTQGTSLPDLVMEQEMEGPSISEATLEDVSLRRGVGPITQAEWQAQQNVIRRVLDPTTGRTRLIKGDGEVLEEIVSRDRQRSINKESTQADGNAFECHFGLH
uniref:ADP-ribosylation factor-like protein 6-interacting protein 4 n=1 Tax=Myxine glutinosa TaxID=7769 RepID=UPI00358F2C2B